MSEDPDMRQLSGWIKSLEGTDLAKDKSATRRLIDALYGLAHRKLHEEDRLRDVLDSKDLGEEALLALQKSLPSFRGRTWPSFLAFARSVVDRVVIDFRRHWGTEGRDVDRTTPLGDRDAQPGRVSTPSEIVGRAEEIEHLRDLIEELGPALREALLLQLKGLDGPEIAAELGIEEAAVRQRLSRAMKELAARVRNPGPAGPPR